METDLVVAKCGRCGRRANILHRLVINRDSEIRERQQAYWDLCGVCLAVVEHVLYKED